MKDQSIILLKRVLQENYTLGSGNFKINPTTRDIIEKFLDNIVPVPGRGISADLHNNGTEIGVDIDNYKIDSSDKGAYVEVLGISSTHGDSGVRKFYIGPLLKQPWDNGYKPLPDGLEIRDSPIHGQGLFATMWYNIGHNFGKSHEIVNGCCNRFPLGAFVNHSDKPNCKLVKRGFEYDLVCIDLWQVGDELTLDYRDTPCSAEKCNK